MIFKLTSRPHNQEKLVRLLDFLPEILTVCQRCQVEPILDGSLAVFFYTQNRELMINDLDLTCREKYFPMLAEALKKAGLAAEIKAWHVLQIRKNDLKIEFGDPDYWYPGVSIEAQDYLDLGSFRLGVLKFASLVAFYRQGMNDLQTQPEKLAKYLDVKKKYELLMKKNIEI